MSTQITEALPVLEGVQPEYLNKPDHIQWKQNEGSDKRYWSALYRGDVVRVFESGAVWSEESKRLVAGVKSNRITTETASNFHDMRTNRVPNAIKQALEQEFGDTWDYGLAVTAQTLVKIANSPNNKQAAVAAFREIRRSLTGGDEAGAGGGVGRDTAVIEALKEFAVVLDRAVELKRLEQGGDGGHQVIDLD